MNAGIRLARRCVVLPERGGIALSPCDGWACPDSTAPTAWSGRGRLSPSAPERLWLPFWQRIGAVPPSPLGGEGRKNEPPKPRAAPPYGRCPSRTRGKNGPRLWCVVRRRDRITCRRCWTLFSSHGPPCRGGHVLARYRRSSAPGCLAHAAGAGLAAHPLRGRPCSRRPTSTAARRGRSRSSCRSRERGAARIHRRDRRGRRGNAEENGKHVSALFSASSAVSAVRRMS
jgi:hypothetical protein